LTNRTYVELSSFLFLPQINVNGYYQAGVRRFSFVFNSSPAYLSELFEYLYVGGK